MVMRLRHKTNEYTPPHPCRLLLSLSLLLMVVLLQYRALVSILRSEVAQFPGVTPLVHSPSPLPSATVGSSSLPNRSPSTSPPPQPAATSTDSTAAPVVPAAPGAPKPGALEGSSSSVADGDSGAPSPASTVLQSQGQTTEGASRDSSQLVAQAGTQTTEDSQKGDGGGRVARTTVTALTASSAAATEDNPTGTGSSGAGDQEKRVLERAWDLYLQVNAAVWVFGSSGHDLSCCPFMGQSYSDLGQSYRKSSLFTHVTC